MSTKRMNRHERKQKTLTVLRGLEMLHVDATVYSVARAMGMKVSPYLRGVLKELAQDGSIGYVDVPCRNTYRRVFSISSERRA